MVYYRAKLFISNPFVSQPLDFESRQTHNVVVEAVNKHVDPRFVDLGSFRDQTIVRVSVSDIDEPPIFQPAEGAIMEVQEDAEVGALVGVVTARDPDVKNKPVRYGRGSKTNFMSKEKFITLLKWLKMCIRLRTLMVFIIPNPD